jgi:hypothetical protein
VSTSDCACACRTRHGSLRSTPCLSCTRRQRSVGTLHTRAPKSPHPSPIVWPQSQKRHPRPPHEPELAPENSIEPAQDPMPPAFSPTEFLRRLRSAETQLRSLAFASLNRACRNLVPTFPQRSPPSLLTTAACGGLRSAPDCRPQRACLHLSYSCASPFGPALLVTQGPTRTSRHVRFSAARGGEADISRGMRSARQAGARR